MARYRLRVWLGGVRYRGSVTVNISNPTSFAIPGLTLTTSNAIGTGGAIRSGASIALFDATVPGTIAAGASAAAGSASVSARRDHVHGSAAAYTTFATPSFTLGTSNITGSGDSVHAGATLLAFDTTLPDAITFAQSGAVGSATVASRRDHAHAMATETVGMALVGTVEAADASSIVITGLGSTYDTYMIAIADIRPETDGAEPWLRVGDSGGIDSGASDYGYHTQKLDDGGTGYSASASTGDTKIQLGPSGIGNATGEGFGGVYFLHRPGDGAMQPIITGQQAMLSVDPSFRGGATMGRRNAVITLDRIEFLLSTGNIVSGRMTIWGLAHA